jgi:hypothetical protein
MPENIPPSNQKFDSLIGTKDILNIVVGKLTSQILLFSIAIIVLLLGAYSIWESEGIIPTAGILFVFIVGTIGYLFFEQKQKILNGELKAVNEIVGIKMKNISNLTSNSGDKNLKVDLWIERIETKNSSRDIKIVPVKSGEAFKIGEKINIKFKSSNDCYLTLLNIGTSGKLTILFPNSLHQDNFITGGKLYEIPGEEYGFEYQLSGPPGIERLKAIVTTSKVALIESQFTPDGNLFQTISSKAAARDIVIMEKKIEAFSPGDWNEAYFEFKVAE